MERRVLLAIFLSFLVLYAYQAFFVKPVPKPPVTETTRSSAPSEAAAASSAAAMAPAATVPTAAPSEMPATVVGERTERDIVVETRDVIAVFTNRGARLKSWRLKHYLDRDRHPQELVATELAATQPLPFSLQTPDERTTRIANAALYAVKGAPTGTSAQSSATSLTFDYRDADGLSVEKAFTLDPSTYIVTFRASVTSGNHAVPTAVVWGPAVGDQTENSRYIKKSEGLLFHEGKPQRLGPKDIAKQATYSETFRYAGVDDHYFMTVALFPGSITVTYHPVSIPPPAGSKDPARDFVSYSVERTTGGDQPMKFFAGPKDFDVLASIDRDVVRAIDFGMFSFLVVPLLRSLKWINGFIGNYGWSIIILTVAINAIMFPLRHKSVVSMRKMQEIQPQVKAIQDRYAKFKATDPEKQKMNQEMMALYKQKGVNPASGCVPMLLTLPVLYAFYSLLSVSIELRGAPFFGWIHDLSAHDPLYITPILMGISQVWQQKLTPATGTDPAQQKMMMAMPALFTFMFLWAPVGVVLYWLVSNVWGIGQQYLTNYLIGPPTIHTVRPPAERRLKRVGGGKTEAARES